MEIGTSTTHDLQNDSLEILCFREVEDSVETIDKNPTSPDRNVSQNFQDNFSTADDPLNFPLLKKKKKKTAFQQKGIEQSKSYKSEESKYLTEFHSNEESLYPITMSNNYANDSMYESTFFDNASRMSEKLKATNESEDINIDLNFEGIKKKKRKSTKQVFQSESDTPESITNKNMPEADGLWSSLDLDYTYDYLLSRFYRIAKQERPAMEVATAKLTLKPPLIFKVGSKKTSFANFLDICRILHRPPPHLMSFLLVELGTSGSLDGSNHLIIRGRFQQKQIENILRRYIKEYVRCMTCNSLSTVMQKEIRLTFLMCQNCESKRSVVCIKSGFQALTSKRATMKAKSVT